jgi:DNA-binding MarR family transcriptional regulator
MIVLPYLGAAAAERELGRPAPPARRQARTRSDPLRGLGMRLTYRTVRTLLAIDAHPAASNRAVGDAAGVSDQGQISKLLARLQALGLAQNGGDHTKGEPSAWTLTDRGREVVEAVGTQVHA